MTLKKYMLVVLGLGLVTGVHGGIKEYSKTVNGVRIVRVKTGGLLCPSTTTVCYYPTNQPGVLMPLNAASNPGLLGSVAGAAGTATSGALIRPSKTAVSQGSSTENLNYSDVVNNAPGNGKDGNNGNGGNPHFLP